VAPARAHAAHLLTRRGLVETVVTGLAVAAAGSVAFAWLFGTEPVAPVAAGATWIALGVPQQRKRGRRMLEAADAADGSSTD